MTEPKQYRVTGWVKVSFQINEYVNAFDKIDAIKLTKDLFKQRKLNVSGWCIDAEEVK